MLELCAEILAGATIVVVFAIVYLALRSWRVEATMKATTRAKQVSLAGGASFAGLSASAAAILDGPGVIAIHLRARELWRRPIERVSVEAAIAKLDAWLGDQIASEPKETQATSKSRLIRIARRLFDWLAPRTDKRALPDLGIRLLTGLRDVSVGGAITCGFEDPALTGKAAAFLFPLAGVLSPLGILDVSFDWSGANRIDADVEIAFRFVPARVMYEAVRFARHHVHFTTTVLEEERAHG